MDLGTGSGPDGLSTNGPFEYRLEDPDSSLYDHLAVSYDGASLEATLRTLLTPAAPAGETESGAPQSSGGFVEKGVHAFQTRDYAAAVNNWRHAVIDDPPNGLLTMLLAQALFATGAYDEAAFATRAAMRQLPMAQWGVVVGHYTKLYATPQDYTDQLRALEHALQAKPDDVVLHFLTAFQYGYLGFQVQAIDQLERARSLAPDDAMTDLLRNQLLMNHDKFEATHHAHAVPPAHSSTAASAIQIRYSAASENR